MAQWKGDPDIRSVLTAGKGIFALALSSWLMFALAIIALAIVANLFKPLLLPLSPILKYVGVYKTETVRITSATPPATCVVVTKKGNTHGKLTSSTVFPLCQKNVGATVTVTYDPITGDIDSIKP